MDELYEHSKCKKHIQEGVYILILVFKNSKGHEIKYLGIAHISLYVIPLV